MVAIFGNVTRLLLVCVLLTDLRTAKACDRNLTLDFMYSE